MPEQELDKFVSGIKRAQQGDNNELIAIISNKVEDFQGEIISLTMSIFKKGNKKKVIKEMINKANANAREYLYIASKVIDDLITRETTNMDILEIKNDLLKKVVNIRFSQETTIDFARSIKNGIEKLIKSGDKIPNEIRISDTPMLVKNSKIIAGMSSKKL